MFGNARSWFGARIERGKKDLAAEESGGKAGTQAGRGHMGRNLSPFSLLDPEEEENICRRMKDAGFSEERIQMHRHAQQGRGGGEMGDMVNVGGSELLHIPGHGQAACGDVMGAGVTANGGGEGGMENIWGAGAGGTEGRNPNAAVDVDVDGVMGMQDGLWEEMMGKVIDMSIAARFTNTFRSCLADEYGWERAFLAVGWKSAYTGKALREEVEMKGS